jgi:hypothetical protein
MGLLDGVEAGDQLVEAGWADDEDDLSVGRADHGSPSPPNAGLGTMTKNLCRERACASARSRIERPCKRHLVQR